MHIGMIGRLSSLTRIIAVLALATATSALAQAPQKCDVNGDGQINSIDIGLILAARNTPATGPNDPRDPDNNGVIDALDVRTCQQRCTFASCSLPPGNTAPVANNDVFATQEDTTLVVPAPGVLGNDTDANGNPLTAAVVTGPVSGTLVLSSNGSFSYMPSPNFAGPVTFTYRASDGALNSNTATVTINVTPVNDGPSTQPDSYSTAEDTPLTVPAPGVLGNDADPDSATLTAALVSGPPAAAGTLTLNGNGSFTFTPAANFNGTATFTYRASDGVLLSNTTTVTIAVTPVNDAPVANPDAYSTDEDMPLTVAVPGVLGNDTDPDGGGLSAVLQSPPATGTLVLNADGSFSYTPVANASGPVSFTYRAFDGLLNSNVGTATITILPLNDAPVAAGDSYSTAAGTPLSVVAPGVLGNDTDQEGSGLTAVLGVGPANGALVLNASGGFLYTPNPGFTGGDSFTYRANDGNLNSNFATVSITVTPLANTAPVANDDTFGTPEDTTLVVGAPGVLGNDTDADGNPLTAVLVSAPANGVFNLNANGSFTYTPAANFNGPRTFTYRANDGTLNSNVATATINVTPVNDAPVASTDSYSTPEDTPLSVPAPGVLGNDVDVDGDVLTAQLVAGPTHGALTLNPNGSFTYTPAANYNGPDSFTYRASDGVLTSNTVTVSITVSAVNDAPTANAGPNQNVSTGAVVQLDGSASSDPEGSPLTYAWSLTRPAGSAAVLSSATVVNPTFTADVAGTYTAQLTVSDGTLFSTPSQVTIVAGTTLPAVTVTTANGNETGPVNGGFTFTRTGGNQAVALTVTYSVGGSATNGVDYTAIASSFTIPAGQPSATLPIVVQKDNVYEPGNETVVLTFGANANYTISPPNATVTIADDPVIVTVTPANGNEAGPANGGFLFARTGGNQAVALTVTYSVGGSATNGVDYTAIASSFTIPAGQASATLPIVVQKDNVVEVGGETVVLTFGANPAYAPIAPATSTVTIADDPAIVTVTPTNGNEAGPVNGGFLFARTGGNQAVALTVTYSVGGSATNGVDYTAIASSFTIPAGQASANLPIVVQKDNAYEPGNETVVLTFGANAAYAPIAPVTSTVTIADDPVIVTVATTDGSESGPVNGAFTFTRSGGNVAAALTVTYSLGGSATNGVDYTAIASSFTIPATQTSATLPIVVQPDANAEGPETVVLTFGANAAYAPISPATSTVTISDTTLQADIRVTKIVSVNPTPTIGENVTFRIQAANLGPGNATGVVVQDLLPSGYQYVSKQVFQGTYDETTGVWSAGAINNGVTFTLDVTAKALATGNYTNTATRTASTPGDGNAANDTASVTATPAQGADIRITKVITNNPTPTIGENVTFRIQAANLGPGNAMGVVVQDLLPSGYQYVSKQVFQGSYDETTGVWSAGNINNGNTFTLDITAKALATGNYTNTATRTASTPGDGNAANDSASVTATPAQGADIRITKVITNNPTPTIGENVTFRIQAANLGPGNATGVVVQDLLPSGYQYVSKQVFQGSYNETTGVWSAGNINNGNTFTLDITATALPSGNYTNTATRTASTPADGNAANDSASITATPAAIADVRITKVITNNPTPTIGENVTFRIQAANLGPGNAMGVVVQDLLPSGYQYVSKQVFQGSYNETTGVWSAGNINNGNTFTLDITATALPSGNYTNTATRTASTPADGNAANDSASITATPAAIADVRITKVITNNPTPTIGENVTFRIQAANLGPGNAMGVVVQDLLPSGYQYVSKQVFQGSYNETTGVWSAGNINNGNTFTLDITATALPSGNYTNTATRTASTPADGNAANDSASITATPAAIADVRITKVITNNPTPTIGENVTFRIQAANLGPGNAMGVVVQDLLPSGYQYVSKQVFQGSYNETTGVWSAGNINNGNTFTLDITATALATGNYTNTATRSASFPTDGNAANDSASITATPAAIADVRITKVVTNNPAPAVGQNVTFRIQAANLGPGNASGVVVQDLLPSGYQYVSKQVFQGSYNETTGVWNAGTINNGNTFTLDITATALATGNYTNTATRSASFPTDGNAANDSASVTVTPVGALGANLKRPPLLKPDSELSP